MKKFDYTGPVVLEITASRKTKGMAFTDPKGFNKEKKKITKQIADDQQTLSFAEFIQKYNVADIARDSK